MKASCGSVSHRRNSPAFTLVELAVLLALIAVGACMLARGAAHTRPDVLRVQCLSNLRRLMTACQMYAHDNQDRLVTVLHGGSNRGGASGMGWTEGWLDWTTYGDNTNVNFFVNPRYADIAPYVNGVAALFRCPANNYLSASQRALGWSQRVRSYSAQVGIGAGNAESGPWDPFYKHVTKALDLLNPGPGDTAVLVEEHPDSINDPAWFPPRQTQWIDPPATYHSGGCAFGFADTHSEIHRWRGSLTSARARRVLATDGAYINNAISAAPGDPDIHWMSFHSQRASTNSY